jgi:hypothetical protein
MEDFDSLNEKQLESLERGLSDLKNNRVMTSDEFWKGLLSNKEQQLLIDEAYENYKKEILRQRQLQKEGVNRLRSQGKRLKVSLIELLTKEEFINKCKTDTEFSEKWGLKIEERELTTVRERKKYDIHFDDLIGEYPDHHETLDKRGVPRKIITITYNYKTITNYEH